MAKRWIGLALIAGCLSLPAAANAQCGPACYEDPNAGLGPPTCGPLNPAMAPAGPDCDMGIPDTVRNAFDHYCGSRPDFCCDGMWFSAEYLYLWLKDPYLAAPIVTTGATGVLGAADTRAVLNGDDLDYSGNSGGRLSAGFWLDAERIWSVELGGFVTEKRGTNYLLDQIGPGNPPIFIPFFDNSTGTETALPVTNVAVNAASRLWGSEVNMVYAGSNIALLAGFRYIDLSESLDIYFNQPPIGPDYFSTRNQFYGGQLGIRAAGCFCNCLFAAVTLKAAIGRNDQSSFTFGETIGADGAITPTSLFVHTTNTGKINDHEFCFVPEGEIRLGFQASRNVFIFAGGTYQYWLKALRPGDQISHATLPVGVNTPNGPIVPFTQSDFWAFGASFGFEMRY